MRKILFALVLAIIPMLGFSQHRSKNEAITIAQEFWGNRVNRAKLKTVSQTSLVKAKARATARAAAPTNNSKHSFYVINDEEHDRFVIVSSDDRLYKILGFSDNGLFDSETAPIALIDMLNSYDEQYTSVYSDLDKAPKGVQKNYSFSSVQPLIQSKWGQSDPYNFYCPKDIKSTSEKNCATGCVATAMAQVMYFWKYPESGTDSNSYTSSTQHIYQSMDFSSMHFDWENMVNEYNSEATETQKSAVASLMHAAGVSVSMDYADESGAYAIDMAYALSHFWKYNPNVSYKKKQYYSDDAWNQLILGELSEGHPILYAGQGNTGGHQFILDGYNGDGMYHFNFGWSGLGDGYYTLEVLAPVYDIFGYQIPLGDYSSKQEMVCYVVPQEYGQPNGEFYASSSLELSSAKVGSSKYVRSTIYNCDAKSTININGNTSFTGEIGVGVFDKDFQFVKSLCKRTVSINGGYGKSIFENVTFDSSTFVEGNQYYIALYVHSDNIGYSIARTEKGAEDYYLATVKNGNISFEAMKQMGEPTPVVNDVVTGLYNATSTQADGFTVSWQINLWQDESDATKYWISNLDPTAKKKGYTYDNGWNKVYGYVNENGTKLQIPVDQTIGKDILLRNYTGGNVLLVYLTSETKSMSIESVWGCEEIDYTSTNTTVKEFSRYEGGCFEFTTEKTDEPEIIDVASPLISVSGNHVLTISCSTEGASIYYTINGTQPSSSNSIYNTPIEIEGNCTIKAVAIKDGHSSEVSTYTVSDFICVTPTINQTAESNIINITSDTRDASIYYTLDNTTPTKASTSYTGAFPITKSCVVKAIAFKSDYKESPIATQSVIYYPPIPDGDDVVISGNVAGELASRVSSDKLSATRWTISGEINGTDIAFIREVLDNGKMTDLDLGNAIIISGGEPYYKTSYSEHFAENNVVGGYMFYKAKSLISLVLPSTIQRIESSSIQDCDNLATIAIPELCKEVELSAINNCKNLSSIHIGKSLEKFEPRNGNFCPALKTITVDLSNTNFASANGILYSKDMDILYKYPSGKTESSFEIPSSVKIIDDYAFSSTSLEHITMSDGLEAINTGAFDGCKGLLSVKIPQTVKAIGMFAFQNCAKITNVVIPDQVKELESFVFGYCVNLRDINIGASIDEINGSAFTGCTSLQSFIVSKDNNTYTAEGGILYSKDLIALVRCPLALYSDEMILGDEVCVIESNAFQNCKNIKKFKLPEGLKEIGSSAFDKCTMEAIAIPNSVEKIGTFAFQNCTNLKNFSIPNATGEIPTFMLAYCDSLEYLYIHNNVKTIDSYAFTRAKKLNTIECWIDNISGLDMAVGYNGDYTSFKDIKEDCTWHVPEGCAEVYKSQPWWVSTWIVIDDLKPTTDGIDNISTSDILKIEVVNGNLQISSAENTVLCIYGVDGMTKKTVVLRQGETVQINLPYGMYIIDGKKYVLK